MDDRKRRKKGSNKQRKETLKVLFWRGSEGDFPPPLSPFPPPSFFPSLLSLLPSFLLPSLPFLGPPGISLRIHDYFVFRNSSHWTASGPGLRTHPLSHPSAPAIHLRPSGMAVRLQLQFSALRRPGAHVLRPATISSSSPALLHPQLTPAPPRRFIWKKAFFEKQAEEERIEEERTYRHLHARNYEDDDPEEEGWRFEAAAVIQRLPLLFHETPDWHCQYRLWEYDRGLKAGALQEVPPELRPDWVDPNAPKTSLEEEEDEQRRKTEEELLYPPKLTPADYYNDTRHLYRKLQNSLYFLAQEKETGVWRFPSVFAADKTPLRNQIEDSMPSIVGRRMRTSFVGNAPIGYLRVSEEKPTKLNKGRKIFFFHSLHVQEAPDEAVLKAAGYQDFRWLTHAELQEYLVGDLAEISKTMIMPEEFDVATAETYGYEWDESRQHYRGMEPEAYKALLDKKHERTMFPYPKGHKIKPAYSTRPPPMAGFPTLP